MIGTGACHIRTVCAIAQAQAKDNLVSPAIERFAALGNWGAHPSNEERDLHVMLRGLHGLELSTYDIKLQVQARLCYRN